MARRPIVTSIVASKKGQRTRSLMKAARRKQPQCEFCGQCSPRPCLSAEKASMCFLRFQVEPPLGDAETETVSKGSTP